MHMIEGLGLDLKYPCKKPGLTTLSYNPSSRQRWGCMGH